MAHGLSSPSGPRVLAPAQVGIATGTGADIAMESAAVTLIKGDLEGIVRARRLSRATMRNIRENLFFAFVFNALAVPIAPGRSTLPSGSGASLGNHGPSAIGSPESDQPLTGISW